MTGGNTNSNVIFAPLQQTTAELVGISALVVLGARTTGGAVVSMLAPGNLTLPSRATVASRRANDMEG